MGPFLGCVVSGQLGVVVLVVHVMVGWLVGGALGELHVLCPQGAGRSARPQ
jgi:hypothetical protein